LIADTPIVVDQNSKEKIDRRLIFRMDDTISV